MPPQPRSPYRRFDAAELRRETHGRREWQLATSAAGTSLRLSDDELALARLFDGERSAPARVEAAGGRADEAALERLALRLAEAGLLRGGRREPLPVPPQTDAEAAWQAQKAAATPAGFPPSTVPGSLAGAGGPGAIGGSHGATRGGSNDYAIEINHRPWVWLGGLVNWVMYHPFLRVLLWCLAALSLFGVWQHRHRALIDLLPLAGPYRFLMLALVHSTVINIVSQSARAHAVLHSTREAPRMGLRFRWGFLPQIDCDTEGAAERASARGRRFVVGSTLNATLLLYTIAIYGWLMMSDAASALPTIQFGLAVLAAVMFLLRLNPLAQRDGYYLLAQTLGIPDLRDRAWLAPFGGAKAWSDRPLESRRALGLYLGAIVTYFVAVVLLVFMYPAVWLEELFGGTGVLIVLGITGLVFFQQYRRLRSGRGRIGSMKLSHFLPSRRTWIIIGVLAVLAMIPYRYEPSGALVVLPKQRADVRALIAGDVREVLVKEGGQVEQGELIARLNDHAQNALVATSVAKLKRLEAQLALARLGARDEEVDLARQRVETAKVRSNFADAEAVRMKSAYDRRAVAIQDYERARGTADVQRAELAETQRNLSLVQAPTRDESIEALLAEIEAEKAQLAYAEQQLEYTRVRAPIAGTVVSGELMFAVGNYYQVGEQVAIIEQSDELLAEVQMPESSIGSIEIGADASVKVWAFPGSGFDATVHAIAPNAEQGEYGKIVRVLLAIDDPGARLLPEMTGQAKIASGWYPAGYVFTRALVRFVLIEVWSWLP